LSLISSAGKNNNVAEWFYIPTWQRSIFSSRDGDEKSAPSILLVFANKGGLGDLLVNELVKEGHEVIMVSHGAKFGKVDDLRYTIHPQQREDYDMLLQDLCSTKKIPEKVVHMWNITDNRPREQESIEAVNEAQILGFYSLLYLAAAMGKQELEGECQITVITNNMQEVAGEEWLCPEKATLLGPIKVIPQEYANINCRSIDIVLPGEGSWQERKLVNMLLRELRTKITEPVMAYRGNHRLVQMFTPIQLDKLEGDVPRLRKRGVYLITGGLGGIGLTIAKYLVERVQAKLILVGRRALPARQEWARWLEEQEKDDEVSRRIRDVQELEALGGEIILGAADVSNFGQMQKIIADARERFGTINGVIHAAGLPGGGLIQRQTWEMTNPVLAPKVQGTLILDRLLRDVQLDFFILFSSRRSIIGLLGQVDYSAANAFLDAFAYDKASRDGTFCVAINWSSWADVGMASRNEEHLGKDLDISLQDGILPQEGIDAFTRVLGSDLIQVVVSTQDFVELVEQHKSLSASGLAKSLENLHLSRTEKVTCPRPRVSSSYIPPKNKMEHVLADIWKAFFGIDRIGIHDNFFELGATSLDIIHLGQKVKEATGMHIPIGTFFRFPRISELALHLSKKEEGKAAVKGVTRWDKIKTARKNLEKRVRVIRK
jgi:NAD(P)-dependent dehydrogenase (short-subunit alcohol dehydrogenase family)/acyl carrier protein